MSSHQRTLAQIFSHPIAMNIRWKDIVHLLESLGATVTVVHGRQKVVLGDHEATFRIPHGKTLDNKDEVIQLRHFLERAGFAPEKK
ncbi:MAG: hypothetical protein ACYTJ0_07830 [Planctomycetota bacterium]|jgi:hypothetical protein